MPEFYASKFEAILISFYAYMNFDKKTNGNFLFKSKFSRFLTVSDKKYQSMKLSKRTMICFFSKKGCYYQ